MGNDKKMSTKLLSSPALLIKPLPIKPRFSIVKKWEKGGVLLNGSGVEYVLMMSTFVFEHNNR